MNVKNAVFLTTNRFQNFVLSSSVSKFVLEIRLSCSKDDNSFLYTFCPVKSMLEILDLRFELQILLYNEQCAILQLRNGMKKRTVEAEKRYLIYEPPPVLTLHLKRFEQVIWES